MTASIAVVSGSRVGFAGSRIVNLRIWPSVHFRAKLNCALSFRRTVQMNRAAAAVMSNLGSRIVAGAQHVQKVRHKIQLVQPSPLLRKEHRNDFLGRMVVCTTTRYQLEVIVQSRFGGRGGEGLPCPCHHRTSSPPGLLRRLVPRNGARLWNNVVAAPACPRPALFRNPGSSPERRGGAFPSPVCGSRQRDRACRRTPVFRRRSRRMRGSG